MVNKKFCVKCGSEINSLDKFCKECGTSIKSQSEKPFDWAEFMGLVVLGVLLWMVLAGITLYKFMKRDIKFRMYLVATIISFIGALILVISLKLY